MCFPSVSAGGALTNVEKELYTFTCARLPLVNLLQPQLLYICLVIFSSLQVSLLGSPYLFLEWFCLWTLSQIVFRKDRYGFHFMPDTAVCFVAWLA